MKPLTTWFVSLAATGFVHAAAPSHQAELIFPPETWHNHGSCLVEAPNGDLIVCWFHGSGERREDDVRILGARKSKATGTWSEPFELADTPGFPDTNCCLIIDPQQRLWLFWPTILANTWESALMNYKISDDYLNPGPPLWREHANLFMKPAPDFADVVRRKTAAYLDGQPASDTARQWAERNAAQAADKLTSRLGWFTRAHPYITANGRMIVGLYSDGFSFSMATYTDDWGKTWKLGEPIVGGGNIQPSFARKRDGTLVAYMRDNGPPPKRVLVSESTDEGVTWGKVYDHPVLPNPGAGLELMNLTDGRFLVIYNDTEQGRHSLAVSVSEDEGQTFRWTRHLERGEPSSGSYHYPSIIQSRDGTLHCSYSRFVKDLATGQEGKSIKYATFNLEWIMAGDEQ